MNLQLDCPTFGMWLLTKEQSAGFMIKNIVPHCEKVLAKADFFFCLHEKITINCSLKISDINEKKNLGCY